MFASRYGPPQSTGDSSYGTHLSPLQLQCILDAGVRMQYQWAQLIASPYSYPTHYEYAGPSVGGGGGFAFGGGKSKDSALMQMAFTASTGTVDGIVQLENLQSLRGPFGYGALWWQVAPPETLPDFLLAPLTGGAQESSAAPEVRPEWQRDRPEWLGDRPGLPAQWQVFPSSYPVSTCWGHVPSEFSAFAYASAKGAATPGMPPEMSLF